MTKSILQQGIEAQAKSMREFGYPDTSAAMVAKHHEAWLRGDSEADIIFKFSVSAFEDYPEIFGEPQ